MTTTQYLDDAIAAAEKLLLARDDPRPQDKNRLADHVKHVRGPDPAEECQQLRAEQLTHLARLLGALGMKTLSLSVADMTLRHMEVSEADHQVYAASVWDGLGSLLAEHGDLERSRLVLCRALGRAERGSLVPERGRILTNLSAVSLRMGHLDDADVWAGKALREMDTRWEDDDPEARLTADWVRLDVASARKDFEELVRAADAFERSVERFIRLKGGAHPTAVAARRALATARFAAAAAAHDVERGERELCELEIVKLNASALLGGAHRETVVAQAALAVAEFEAAGGGSGSLPRRQRAVSLLESAEELAVEVFGREHAQTAAIWAALADLRVVLPKRDLRPAFDRLYLLTENGKRNAAKLCAVTEERHTLRLIAHGGGSYLLEELDRFYSGIIDALERHVTFHVIISNPWSNLAVFLEPPAGATERREGVPGFASLVDMVMCSDYYQRSFLPVIEAYLHLHERYAERIELRLSPIDIPGSTFLTSNVGFFEPYITTNPSLRTRRGLSTVEMMFREDTVYYMESLAEFRTQWELSSTWKQFQAREEQFKQALRDNWRHWPTIA
ncbi:hypothetical protein [Streptomyces alboniger]|uniref:Tetratricopeptide repeat protein n=1 Tax=Streptomyces alboniger TaxID=132473 RepID=A0A5J6HDH7_STRAD|nr:hypothetical protein [Streptomyces alboniger]QEV18269.1 hypothetical protein CP975_12855 [Streptomyces alboniger]